MEEGDAQQPAEVYSVDASIQVCALATQEALTLRDSNFLVNVPSMVSEIGAAIVMDDPAACEDLDALALEARVQVGVACLREDLEESRAVTKDCWDAYQMCLEDHLGPAAVKAVSTDVPNGDAFTKVRPQSPQPRAPPPPPAHPPCPRARARTRTAKMRARGEGVPAGRLTRARRGCIAMRRR